MRGKNGILIQSVISRLHQSKVIKTKEFIPWKRKKEYPVIRIMTRSSALTLSSHSVFLYCIEYDKLYSESPMTTDYERRNDFFMMLLMGGDLL